MANQTMTKKGDTPLRPYTCQGSYWTNVKEKRLLDRAVAHMKRRLKITRLSRSQWSRDRLLEAAREELATK